MTTGTDRGAPTPRLIELQIADDAEAWTAAGFTVAGDIVAVGDVRLRLVGRPSDGKRGVVGWTLGGVGPLEGDVDGLPTTTTGDDPVPLDSQAHPNGVTNLDHLVVLTPDLDRTLEALAAAGFDLRRIRETTSYGAPMRQAFYRLGTTILEVVSGDVGSGMPATDAPATFFGLAVDVDDLDLMAASLGDGLGAIKVAVQPGRRIATLRHQVFGMSVAVAAMDDHADR